MTTYFDTATGNRLKFIEKRRNNMALFDDLDDGGRVLCHEDAVDLYPRRQWRKHRYVETVFRPDATAAA